MSTPTHGNVGTAVNPDPLLTVAQAAAYASVSTVTVYRLTSEEALPVVRIGRAVRIRRSALDAFLTAAERG